MKNLICYDSHGNNVKQQIRTPAMGTEWGDVFWRGKEYVQRSLHSNQLDYNISGKEISFEIL